VKNKHSVAAYSIALLLGQEVNRFRFPFAEGRFGYCLPPLEKDNNPSKTIMN